MPEQKVIGRVTAQITVEGLRYNVEFLGVRHHEDRIGWPFNVYKPDGRWWFLNTTGEMSIAEAIEYAAGRIWWKDAEEKYG